MSKVTVNIFGQDYTIAGEESEDKIINIANIVDGKMRDINEKADRSLPLSYLAVLSAINITNDLLQAEEETEGFKNVIKQMEGDVKHYEELWNQEKIELEKYKSQYEKTNEEKLFYAKENENLTIQLKNAEKANKSLAQGQGSIREEIRKGVEAQLKDSKSRYKDLENNFFDLQMENIKMKSELEKLRGEMK